MKISFLSSVLLLTAQTVFCQHTENYYVIINNDTIRTDLDKTVQYKTSSGEKLNIRIAQPDVVTYSDDMISFKHDKSLSVSNTHVDVGIEQCALINATGSGFAIQKYKTINPSSLTDLMMQEIIKESVSYGYKKVEKPFKRKLVSGQTVEGKQVTLTYKDEVEIYTVAAYGRKDEGIIIITMLLENGYNDGQLIELFYDTFELK